MKMITSRYYPWFRTKSISAVKAYKRYPRLIDLSCSYGREAQNKIVSIRP